MSANLLPDGSRRNGPPHLRLVVDRDRKPDATETFAAFTAARVMAEAEAGTLDPRVVAYLLAGVGLPVCS